MEKRKYKVGDRVEFYFLGESLKGVIEKIETQEMFLSKDNLKYIIFDGKYRYPLPIENIKSLIK